MQLGWETNIALFFIFKNVKMTSVMYTSASVKYEAYIYL